MQVNIMPDPFNFGLQIVSTVILFLILRHYLFNPISELLEARSEKTISEIKEAQAQKQEATKLRQEYESRIDEAKEEARSIVEGAKKRGDQLGSEIVEKANQEANDLKVKARTDIEREKAKALDDLKSEVASIAMLAATKVVEKELDDNTHKNMINKFIDEVGESKWKN